jgi:transformation/transcription domain-associated protein
MLNEEDVRYGLWKRRTITPDTRAGLSLIQHGFWQRAQEVFYNAINKARQVHILIMEKEFYLEF